MGNVSDIQWNLSSLWCWWGIMVERLERVVAWEMSVISSGICPLFGVGGA